MGFKPRVLIAEDDPDTLVILRINLTAAGMETMLAGDGRTALARIEADRPDAVVLDVLLPGIDGWQVLEELHTKGNAVPVVMVRDSAAWLFVMLNRSRKPRTRMP